MRRLLVISAYMLPTIAACTNLPTPDYVQDGTKNKSPFTVVDLTNHIRCELEKNPTVLKSLADKKYVAAITLTLKVEDNGGVTPNLAFLDAGTNFTHLIDLNYNMDREQIFTTSYTLDTGKLQNEALGKRTGDAGTLMAPPCQHDPVPGYKYNLSGDLGLVQIAQGGLDVAKDRDLNAPATGGSGGGGISDFTMNTAYPPGPPAQPTFRGTIMPRKGSPPDPALATFGSTVQFTLLHSFDTGPLWKLTGFTGPSGSSKGLVNGGRTTTDSLVVAFSPSATDSDSDKAAAAAAAQAFTTNIILQNLTNTLR